MFKLDFIGLNTEYENVYGTTYRHVYLDSAATTLALKQGYDARLDALKYYANLHSIISAPAKISTESFRQAKEDILHYFGFSSSEYMILFLGSGSTAPLNYFSRIMAANFPNEKNVLVSLMEHHSNDLPHRKWAENVIHIPLLKDKSFRSGAIDLESLENLLMQGSIRYIAINHASNVTGIINPIQDIYNLAHQYRVKVIVDCSQSVVHLADFSNLVNIDAIVFSGHKAYAPGTPGVLIIKRKLMNNDCIMDVGGGIVDDVNINNFQLSKSVDDRFQAGTPDFLGAIQIAATLNTLKFASLSNIVEHEQNLLMYTYERLLSLGNRICIYGAEPKDLQRVGVISFNLLGIHYEHVARILNDFFCISVRSGCFCAHPYVRTLIKETLINRDIDESYLLDSEHYRGMVRISIGAYNQIKDIDRLIEALSAILSNNSTYETHYIEEYKKIYENSHE